jgi:hypothetical protein
VVARARSSGARIRRNDMAFHLAPTLTFCACGDRIVLLDLKADRYFCLGPHLELAFKRWSATTRSSRG